MNKQEQATINSEVEYNLLTRNKVVDRIIDCRQLRTCKATVYEMMDSETGEIYYLLRSYRTMVACIHSGVCYDYLRYNYGYTATSASHIAKFMHDYSAVTKKTWRYI